MFLVFKRKSIALIAGGLVLVSALTLKFSKPDRDYVVSNNDISADESPELGDAVLVSTNVSKIETVKKEREIMRSKMCALLTENIDNPSISPEAKADCENKLLITAENMDKEIKCESLLSLKGYENTVVFISDDIITVSVEKKEITSEDVAKINDVIFGQTGNNNIKIVEVK